MWLADGHKKRTASFFHLYPILWIGDGSDLETVARQLSLDDRIENHTIPLAWKMIIKPTDDTVNVHLSSLYELFLER